MRVKSGPNGASIKGCSSEILSAAIYIEPLFNNAGIELVITSGTGEPHMAINSEHYKGDALDLRSKTLKTLKRKQALLKAIKRKLGPAYVVILEYIGKPYEHYHLHWSPTLETAI